MNWIILPFCLFLLLALLNPYKAELKKQQKVNKLLAQCVLQGITDCKQMVIKLTDAVSERESLKQNNQELTQQFVTYKQSLQILGNKSESQICQELEQEIINLNQRLKSTADENQSLKNDNAELRQQATNLKLENNSVKEENKTLEANKKELEANKKALIQELGGAVGREYLEYATWDLVLQTTQLLVKERDKALKDNQLLQHKNNQLQSENVSHKNEINNLKNLILNKESELNSLRRNQSDTNAHRQLDNLRNQLSQKENNLINLNEKLNESQRQIANFTEKIKTKDTILNQLEQEKLKLDKTIQNFQEQLRQKDAKIDSLEGNICELRRVISSLEQKSKNLKPQSDLEIDLSYNQDKIQNFIREIENLNQEIMELKSNDSSLKTYPSVKQPDGTLDLLTEFDDLVYFVQDYFNVSGIEKIDKWRTSQQFYFSLVNKLYIVNLLLVYRVIQLEESANEADFIGKAIWWNNKIIAEELRMILSNIYFEFS